MFIYEPSKSQDAQILLDHAKEHFGIVPPHWELFAKLNPTRFELFIKDKERIENIIEQKLTFGRAHYLRFEIHATWQIWEDANMEWDSSLSYADKEGFRCGVCYPYSVFDILTRNKLNLNIMSPRKKTNKKIFISLKRC